MQPVPMWLSVLDRTWMAFADALGLMLSTCCVGALRHVSATWFVLCRSDCRGQTSQICSLRCPLRFRGLQGFRLCIRSSWECKIQQETHITQVLAELLRAAWECTFQKQATQLMSFDHTLAVTGMLCSNCKQCNLRNNLCVGGCARIHANPKSMSL